MNSVINIFFLLLHYTLYGYLLSVLYKKYIRPYLHKEQQAHRALMLQLHQKRDTAQELSEKLMQQVSYLSALFKKIAAQQQQARQLKNNLEDEHKKLHTQLKERYCQQLELIARHRQAQHIYKQLVPAVIKEVRVELDAYGRAHGDHYLDDAIKLLKQQSLKRTHS